MLFLLSLLSSLSSEFSFHTQSSPFVFLVFYSIHESNISDIGKVSSSSTQHTRYSIQHFSIPHTRLLPESFGSLVNSIHLLLVLITFFSIVHVMFIFLEKRNMDARMAAYTLPTALKSWKRRNGRNDSLGNAKLSCSNKDYQWRIATIV